MTFYLSKIDAYRSTMEETKNYNFIKNSDIFSHLSSLNYLPRWIVLFMDLTLSLFSYMFAYYIVNEFSAIKNADTDFSFVSSAAILLFTQLIFFWIFHTYSGVLRYSGYVDAAKILLSIVSNLLFIGIINFIFKHFNGLNIFTFNSILIYSFINFFLLFLLRLVTKTTFDMFSQSSGKITPIMIYGTQSAAVGIARLISSEKDDVKYKLVGFIDDDPKASEKFIMGVKVYPLNEETIKKHVVNKAKAIIVSPLKMKQENINQKLDVFLNNNLSVLTSPPMSVWDNELPNIKEIKSIQIEDLLERPCIDLNTENIEKHLSNKVILITGAAGSIGSEIVHQVTKYSPRLVVILDQAETPMHNLRLELEEKYPNQNYSLFLGDVRNQQRMEYMMDMYRPDIIFHAAAYKHVPLMEDNPVESIQVNVQGTKIMADLAVKYDVERFVMISTDKAVNPTNVMGASKRIAEIYVQSLFKKYNNQKKPVTKFITTRFGNVLGSNGSVIPLFKKQIEKGGPITVTHPEIIRYFMTIPEACSLVLEAGVMGKGGEIYIFDMGSPVKIVNLARKMIRLAGYLPEVDIKIEYTGLRPGEKLYEELLNHKEKTTKTHNEKIMVATVQEFDFDNIAPLIDELIQYSNLSKNFMTVSQMKKIVPEFLSKNSQYERLDN